MFLTNVHLEDAISIN